MKINKSHKELKTKLESLGHKVYFVNGKVKISWDGHSPCSIHTYREAYRISKGVAGDGKSVRPWAKDLKKETKRVTRTKIRDQITKGDEDIHCSRKEASDPWKFD